MILVVMSGLHRLYGDITIIHGAAPGADSLAGECAEEIGLDVEVYPAHWRHVPGKCEHPCTEVVGKAAGPIRNRKMLNEGKPDLVVAFHENLVDSRGTKDMVNIAQKAGVTVYIMTARRRQPTLL